MSDEPERSRLSDSQIAIAAIAIGLIIVIGLVASMIFRSGSG